MSNNNDFGLKDTVVYEVEYPTFTRDLGGDIVQLNNGRLLYAFPDFSDNKWGGMLCCDSVDDGVVWSKPRVLIPAPQKIYSHPRGEGLGAPSFLRRQDGMLILSYIWCITSEDSWSHTYYRLSNNEGNTWSYPKILTVSREHTNNVFNNKLIRITSGRIMAPGEMRVNFGLKNDHRGFVSTVWYSDNDGHTWHRSSNVVDMLDQRIECQEPHLVELKNGQILMLFRTYSGYLGRAYSDNEGESWSSGELITELKLPTNSSALHLSRIPTTGDLLLIRSIGNGGLKPNENPIVKDLSTGLKHAIRTPITSTISSDDGKSWSNERIIAGDPYGDYGYPSVLHLHDLTIISYHALDGLHVARIPVNWFYEKG